MFAEWSLIATLKGHGGGGVCAHVRTEKVSTRCQLQPGEACI